MNTPRWITASAVVCFLTHAALSQPVEENRAPTARSTAAALLARPVDQVDWDERSLEFVIDWVRSHGPDANVVVSWGPVAVEGVGRESFIESLYMVNTTVGQVLDEVLAQLSPAGELSYRALGSSLHISTRAEFDRKTFVKVYDASDLLMRVPDFGAGAPRIDIQQAAQAGTGGAATPPFTSPGEGDEVAGRQAETQREETLLRLREMVMAIVEPEHWQDGRGAISVWDQSLVVRASIEVHEQIAGRFRLEKG